MCGGGGGGVTQEQNDSKYSLCYRTKSAVMFQYQYNTRRSYLTGIHKTRLTPTLLGCACRNKVNKSEAEVYRTLRLCKCIECITLGEPSQL